MASETSLAPALLATTGDAATDRAALMALFSATGGSSWEDSEGWGTTAVVGSWVGVTAVDNGGRVVGLNLGSNNLKGAWLSGDALAVIGSPERLSSPSLILPRE